MKFTLSWLKDHLDTSATLDQIVEALTRVGLEVESVEDPAKVLAPYITAKVISVEGRKVTCELTAKDELEMVGTGTHARFVVDQAKIGEQTAVNLRVQSLHSAIE